MPWRCLLHPLPLAVPPLSSFHQGGICVPLPYVWHLPSRATLTWHLHPLTSRCHLRFPATSMVTPPSPYHRGAVSIPLPWRCHLQPPTTEVAFPSPCCGGGTFICSPWRWHLHLSHRHGDATSTASLIGPVPPRGAGTGGLGLAIEGPSEAKMSCKDNKDGSCTVEYIPFTAGDYDVNITFGGHPIPGTGGQGGGWRGPGGQGGCGTHQGG